MSRENMYTHSVCLTSVLYDSSLTPVPNAKTYSHNTDQHIFSRHNFDL